MEIVNLSTPLAISTVSVAKGCIVERVLRKSSESVTMRRAKEEHVTKKPCARKTARRSGTRSKENVLNDILMTLYK